MQEYSALPNHAAGEAARCWYACAQNRRAEGSLPCMLLAGWVAIAITGCGGGSDAVPPGTPAPTDPGSGGDGNGSDAQTYAIGGSVTGLTGSGLVIGNNGTDQLTIEAPGAFAFATDLADGEVYEVSIVVQPTGPENVCVVENGSGVVAGADVDDVIIHCTGPLALTAAAPADGDQDVSRAIEPRLARAMHSARSSSSAVAAST